MSETIFTKIAAGEIPSTKIYEDEKVLAILDIRPNNLGHTIIFPKEAVAKNIHDVSEEILCYMIKIVKKLSNAVKKGVEADGINVRINNGKAAGQEIDHLHIHVIPRFDGDYNTPKHKTYKDGEMEEIAEKIRKEL